MNLVRIGFGLVAKRRAFETCSYAPTTGKVLGRAPAIKTDAATPSIAKARDRYVVAVNLLVQRLQRTV